MEKQEIKHLKISFQGKGKNNSKMKTKTKETILDKEANPLIFINKHPKSVIKFI